MGMSKRAEYVKSWRKNTKKRLVEAFGNKCCVCGYSKYTGALHFHHLDPSIKEKGTAQWMSNPTSWANIVDEMKSCICVCANCHAEIHGNIIAVPENAQRFNEEYSEYKLTLEDRMTPCPSCGKLKAHYNKFCSLSCSGKMRYKVEWDSINLEEMLNNGISYEKIGEQLGCSGASVKKRANKLGFKSKFSHK